MRSLTSAERLGRRGPIPMQMISNGEYMPLPQTPEQREVERRLTATATDHASRLGITPAAYLCTRSAMTAAFGAMNDVHGAYFDVDPAEALDQDAAAARAKRYAGQFIFDAQTHHVRPTYDWSHLTNMRCWAQGKNPWGSVWNPAVVDIPAELENYKFDAYIKDIFLDSDTKLAILTGFTCETASLMPLSSDEIVRSRDLINRMARSRRVLAQGLFWPGYPGNLEEMDRLATELHIDSWKGYAVGDPLSESRYPWRMDDEKLAYPAFEKARRYGIRNICVHKGLLPAVDYQGISTWRFAMVDDVARAARDWPDLNFIIYHAAFRPLLDATSAVEEYHRTGRIPWVTELAEIRETHDVANVYAELGTTFASVCVTFPELAAAILGTCIQGLGADHVIWGTDSIWWGSPQWQIEALRRLELPAAMRDRHGFAPLGPADGPVKNQILGLNLARLFHIDPQVRRDRLAPRDLDGLDLLKAEYDRNHAAPSQVGYGWVRALHGLSFDELFSLHGVLDDEHRPLGEHRAPSPFAGAAPTELRSCPHPGIRHEHERPMNLSALRQATRHWDEAVAGLTALRGWCGGGSQPLTLAELWRLTAAAAVLPAYLLHRAGGSPVLDAGTAVLYKACLGIKFLIEQRALGELLATGAIDDRVTAEGLAEFAETSGWLVGRDEVCAAPAGMIAEFLDTALRGDGGAHSRLATAVGSPGEFQAFARASWQLFGLLLTYSTWSARHGASIEGGAPAPVAGDPPPENRLSLTLGMSRLSAAASALDGPRCAALLEALCSIATPPGDGGELAALRAALGTETDPERAESLAAQSVRDLERRLNAALGRSAGSEREIDEPPPDLSAYRARSRGGR